MKNVTIKNAGTFQYKTYPGHDRKDMFIDGPDSMEVSDGYHTFDELYEHRVTLFIAFCKLYEGHVAPAVFATAAGRTRDAWRSKLHSDGTSYEGWFILGINKEEGKQITYHLPMSRWEETDFAETLEKAPEFDGHTSADVLERIKSL